MSMKLVGFERADTTEEYRNIFTYWEQRGFIPDIGEEGVFIYLDVPDSNKPNTLHNMAVEYARNLEDYLSGYKNGSYEGVLQTYEGQRRFFKETERAEWLGHSLASIVNLKGKTRK